MSYKNCRDTTNCKLVLMADVVAIVVLADVMSKVCGLMLLPLKYVDLWQMESHSGRCNHLLGDWKM